MGSTSVPGLAAKPIVDLQVSVASLQPMDAYREPLRSIGYEHFEWLNEDGVDDYPYFAKPPEPPRAFHIHVAESGSFHERRHLAFRDWLRTHPEDAAEYERRQAEPRHPRVADDGRLRERQDRLHRDGDGESAGRERADAALSCRTSSCRRAAG